MIQGALNFTLVVGGLVWHTVTGSAIGLGLVIVGAMWAAFRALTEELYPKQGEDDESAHSLK